VIVQTVPLVYYAGTYPTAPLTDATAGPFTVDTAVYRLNPHNETITGTTLSLEGLWGGGPSSLVHLPPSPPGIVTRKLGPPRCAHRCSKALVDRRYESYTRASGALQSHGYADDAQALL